MTRLVQQILEAAGAMPDPEAHARYLETLTTEALKARLAVLLLDGTRPAREPVRFWRVPMVDGTRLREDATPGTRKDCQEKLQFC